MKIKIFKEFLNMIFNLSSLCAGGSRGISRPAEDGLGFTWHIKLALDRTKKKRLTRFIGVDRKRIGGHSADQEKKKEVSLPATCREQGLRPGTNMTYSSGYLRCSRFLEKLRNVWSVASYSTARNSKKKNFDQKLFWY